MYNLLIVDDEKTALKNIAESVPWSDFGFDLKEMFFCAEDALAYLKTHYVHCIISDLKMPTMDGLEFAKKVKEQYPDIVFIILSAYSEFSYAQAAISLDVSDYILKPVTVKKISASLQKAREHLDQKHEIIYRQPDYSDKHKVITRLINGEYSSAKHAATEFEKIGTKIDVEKTSFALIRLSVCDFDEFIMDTWPHEVYQFQNAFTYIAETENNNIITYKSGFGFLELMIIGDDEKDFFTYMNNTLKNIEDNCFELLMCTLNYTTLSYYPNIHSFFAEQMSDLLAPNVDSVVDEIMAGNLEKSIELTNNIIMIHSSNPATLTALAQCLMFKLNNYFDITQTCSNVTAAELRDLDASELQNMIYDMLNAASRYFIRKQTKKQDYISAAKKYICDHYNEDLSLTNIAKAVFVSESHLSRTFSDVTGESIVEYIRRIRLSHAKELLLKTNFSVEEICYHVGYRSRNLFFKNFKSLYGTTPKALRAEKSNDEK